MPARSNPSGCAADAEAGPEILDRAEALARLGGNVRLLAEAASLFLEDCPLLEAELAEHFRRGNAPGLSFTAHQLRGALAMLGARQSTDAARQLEDSARAGDLEGAAVAFTSLESALARLKPLLAALTTTEAKDHEDPRC